MVASAVPRIQDALLDVALWDVDVEFEVFPQGTRAKRALFAPQAGIDPCLTPQKRYLFKQSRDIYPDQFWCEIIAYRVGCIMGLDVPPAFAAQNSTTGQCGALIEWFYEDQQRFIYAGDYFQQLLPGFDRNTGLQHNVVDAVTILKAFSGSTLRGDWKQRLVDMFLFDAVIGNTDRHQDNWGFIFHGDPAEQDTYCVFAPLFDNGTSLGHELQESRVNVWTPDRWKRYVDGGKHHMAEARADGCRSASHGKMVQYGLNAWPETCTTEKQRLDLLATGLPTLFDDLLALGGNVPLAPWRARVMKKLLRVRLEHLLALMP
ncbi:hypothetical protein Y602_3665 [Burkholderia pseudomallei MSHR733]|uniref:HipA domain-containing protein n=1 Tax=Burkholderia pseudomallei TaxID=28450 RepID=UPI000536A672|nr:HipA domain-containing protein [Burkholderia pseudomallei]AJX78044.1 hypothetical protein BG16_3499 [Burkholderia pseudomallei MSHR2543]KGW31312.1 hypothetical protein Y602_3665 [Burkholderia pseudomallei MSHR733]